jgi:hypothetical protein
MNKSEELNTKRVRRKELKERIQKEYYVTNSHMLIDDVVELVEQEVDKLKLETLTACPICKKGYPISEMIQTNGKNFMCKKCYKGGLE